MANIRIYSTLESATIFFEGSTIRPKELKTVEAVANPTLEDRVIIRSTVLKDKNDPNAPRIFLAKLNINRIEDKDGIQLVGAPYNYDRTQILEYLNGQFNQTLAVDVNAAYKGVWNPSTNTPNLDSLSPANGDWFFVTATGSYSGSDFFINDQIRYNSGSGVWDRIEDTGVKVKNIEESALGHYDLYVDPSYVGQEIGSNLKPFTTIQAAISASNTGDAIFIVGDNIITSAITLPADKELHFYGDRETQIRYASYNASNGNIFYRPTGDNTNGFFFKDITFKNAGGYAMHIRESDHVYIQDCTFMYNGWNGTALSTREAASGSVLGYDSTQSELQAFYAGANASNGGAVRIENAKGIIAKANTVKYNLRGLRFQDCGIGGTGDVVHNTVFDNIESGIYLAAGASGGSQNFTVTDNNVNYNSNNGILVIGGLNHTIGSNEVRGNWNAGIMGWYTGNLKVRNVDLTNNNRSQYNGIGNSGDARASIEISGGSAYRNPAYNFLAEILDVRVNTTGVGSNTERIGFRIDNSIGTLTDRSKNLIVVDNVGFRDQDYAIDLSTVDLTNVRLVFGNSTVLDNTKYAIKLPDSTSSLNSKYYEIPFSNHITNAQYLDFSVDAQGANILVKEGLNGSNEVGDVINYYPARSLKAVFDGTRIYIISKETEKIQFDDVIKENTSIDGGLLVGDTTNVVNLLNNLFDTTAIGGGVETTFVTPAVNPLQTNPTGSPDTAISGGILIIPSGSIGPNHGTAHEEIPINEVGEYYEITVSGSNVAFTIGLAHSSQTGSLGNRTGDLDTGIYWGARFDDNAGDIFVGASGSSVAFTEWYDVAKYHTGSLHPTQPVTYRIGFNQDGYGYISYLAVAGSNSGSYVDLLRSYTPILTNSTGSQDYHFVYKGHEEGSGLYIPITVVADTGSLQDSLIYYAIESPDDQWTYPLFRTPEEAAYYDQYLADPTGSGAYHEHTFADDTSGTTWYMPNGAMNHNVATHPTGAAGFEHVNWNIAPTGPDSDYTPSGYGNQTLTVDEGDTINYQVAPQGTTSFSTNVTNLPAGLSYDNYSMITGVAPEVSGTLDVNPTASYIINVDQENSFGVTTGSLTLVVNNLTPNTTTLSGSTYQSGSTPPVDSDTLNSGSVIFFDDQLGNRERFQITNDYINQHIYPDLAANGIGTGSIYIGIPVGTPNWADGVQDSDFLATLKFEYPSVNNLKVSRYVTGSLIGSTTHGWSSNDGFARNYFISLKNGIVELAGDSYITVPQPMAIDGGTWPQLTSYDSGLTGSLNVAIATNDTQHTFDISEFNQTTVPQPTSEYLVIENTETSASFIKSNGTSTTTVDGTGITLNAGSTYKFYLDDDSIESGDTLGFVLTSDTGSAYTSGSTLVGTPGEQGCYLEFVVPSDVPPLTITWNGTSQGAMSIAGSTYTAGVTGITLEGPAVNQTGTNLFNDPAVDADGVVWGWLSIDEQLSAGERLVMDNAFMVDLTSAMPDNSGIFIGLKSNSWSENYRNNSIANATYAGARFAIYRYSASDIRVLGYITGATSIGRNFGTNGITNNGLELAFEVTSDGNDIRLMMRSTGTGYNSTNDVNSTTYEDWNSSYKTSTGNQGFGITSLDLMILGDGNVASSAASGEMDSADVDWTGLSEIAIPVAATNATSWDYAIDFSGGSERLTQGSNSSGVNALRTVNTNTTNPPASSGNTSADNFGYPWAVTCVFKIDGNSSNQHIWNQGEGAGTTDDNIYLRVDASRNLYFGWGRTGALNELFFGTLNTNTWYGCYVGFNGTRLSGANATPANLADAFEVRLFSDVTNWQISSAPDSSTSTLWSHSNSTTGGRMDRAVLGDFTVGGRGANRNFHGKVASTVVTTLERDAAMPTTSEITKMVTDPIGWVADYKIGNSYRWPNSSNSSTNFQINGYGAEWATQVWLMGDLSTDGPSHGIRNYIKQSDTTVTDLDLNGIVASDFESVNISGLS